MQESLTYNQENNRSKTKDDPDNGIMTRQYNYYEHVKIEEKMNKVIENMKNLSREVESLKRTK